jgi:prophage regulatory protein
MPAEAVHSPAPPQPPDAASELAMPPLLIDARRAAALLGVSTATWYRMASAGRVPAPVRLSAGCVRWRAAELAAWTSAGCPDRRTWELLRDGPEQHNSARRRGGPESQRFR